MGPEAGAIHEPKARSSVLFISLLLCMGLLGFFAMPAMSEHGPSMATVFTIAVHINATPKG